MNNEISIIGAGAWGTALAQVLAQKKGVTLYTRSKSHADELKSTNENTKYLPGIKLSKNITITSDVSNATDCHVLLIVTPAQALRETLKILKAKLNKNHSLILCCKGLEKGSALFMTDVVEEVLPNTKTAVLSGPNFAQDIASGKPAATTLACSDEQNSKKLQELIATPTFRPYLTSDVIGAELSGALKNVMAIACGIANGLEMGESARASLVTRGLAEISRLGLKMGAQTETFLGLSGVGDMMLTCSSQQSRNYSLGYALGKGKTIDEILKSRNSVTEGLHTAESAAKLSKKYSVEMPICNTMHQCLNEGLAIKTALHEIMNRPLSHE